MLRLAVSMLRHRFRAVLGAGVAVGFAAVLVMSCGMLLQSALQAGDPPVERLGAASIVVQADPSLSSGGRAGLSVLLPEMARVDAHLADRLATVPGVARSVVDRSFDVQVELAHAPTAGHGWSSAALTPYRLVDGRAPEVASEVVLGRTEASGAAIAVGDTITVTVGQARRAVDEVADLVDGLTIPGPDVQVLTRARYLDSLASEASDRNLEVYLLLGIIILFCGLATVNALSMAISQRGPEFALLKMLGASRRQVIRMVRTEAMTIVVFGTTVGALIATPTLAVLSYSVTGSAVPSAPVSLYAGAGTALLLVGLLAGILPTRRALGPEVSPPRRA